MEKLLVGPPYLTAAIGKKCNDLQYSVYNTNSSGEQILAQGWLVGVRDGDLDGSEQQKLVAGSNPGRQNFGRQFFARGQKKGEMVPSYLVEPHNASFYTVTSLLLNVEFAR